jgi:hypothetical protein
MSNRDQSESLGAIIRCAQLTNCFCIAKDECGLSKWSRAAIVRPQVWGSATIGQNGHLHRTLQSVTNAWGNDESDPITYHFENGVELVGCLPRYNPFGGADPNHLAAIEHHRTARDLLKKSTKRIKEDGTEPNSVKRLFQAIKLTESALRHVRRCQLMNKKTDIQELA